jgi:1-acyl-sn-glycerol-3-phosphate acyltransferase
MLRCARLAGLIGLSAALAASLFATAWLIPRARRGRWRTAFQGAWARGACAILGIRVEVVGNVPAGGMQLAVSNHLGYVDILVLGSVLPAAFVSKAEVGRWPLIGILADLAGTEFVEREYRGTCRDLVCWHGDASFAPHAFRLLGLGRIRFRVSVGQTIPCEGAGRKELARASRERVADLRSVSTHRTRLLPGDFIWIHALP